MRLAIITTHPIQYYVPVFQRLQQHPALDIMVYYTAGQNKKTTFDHGFKKNVIWDIPVLQGYPYEWVNNTASHPGSQHFTGIINPDLIVRIKLFKPDALLVYGWAYVSHLKILRYFKNRIPILFRGDSTLLDISNSAKAMARSLLLRWVYKQIDFALYTGINSKAYFKKYGVIDSQLIYAPHAVDNARFLQSHTLEAESLKKRIGVAENELLILFAGKFENKKDPCILLQAFKNLNYKHMHLLMVGNGELEHSLLTKAGNNPRVHFFDFQNQSEMPAVYQAADVFCLPSKGPAETWGLAVNEAMACRKAVLVSDKVGCAVDLVRNGYNGFIFEAGNLPDLIDKLTLLIAMGKQGLKVMGENSGDIVKDFNFDVQVNTIVNIVQDAR